MTNGDFVVAVEHKSEIPISTGRRTIPRLGLVQFERSIERGEGVNDELLNNLVLEVVLGGNLKVISVSRIDESLLDFFSFFVNPFLIAQRICDGEVNGYHHNVSDDGRKRSSLRKTTIEESQT